MRSGSGATTPCREACSRVREKSFSSNCSGAFISLLLYFRIDVKKSRETCPELPLDLVFTSFQSVHGDVCVPSRFQFDRGRAHLGNFIGGQETETVYQCQICHPLIVSQGLVGECGLEGMRLRIFGVLWTAGLRPGDGRDARLSIIIIWCVLRPSILGATAMYVLRSDGRANEKRIGRRADPHSKPCDNHLRLTAAAQ